MTVNIGKGNWLSILTGGAGESLAQSSSISILTDGLIRPKRPLKTRMSIVPDGSDPIQIRRAFQRINTFLSEAVPKSHVPPEMANGGQGTRFSRWDHTHPESRGSILRAAGSDDTPSAISTTAWRGVGDRLSRYDHVHKQTPAMINTIMNNQDLSLGTGTLTTEDMAISGTVIPSTGTFDVTGDMALTGDMAVTGGISTPASATIGGDLAVTGDMTSGPFAVTGNISVTGTVDGVDIAALKTDVDGFPDALKNLTVAEIGQLENIGTNTVSSNQWAMVSAMNQYLGTSYSPAFNALVITNNITVGGTVDGVDVAALETDVNGFPDELKNLTAAEVGQLENIGGSTVSSNQWAMITAMDQYLGTGYSPAFLAIGVTNNITVGGTVDGIDIAGSLDQAVKTTSAPTFAGLTISDGNDIVFDTTTGTKIGTATAQKIGFWNVTPVVQPVHIADADGTLADATTKINAILAQLATTGLQANV